MKLSQSLSLKKYMTSAEKKRYSAAMYVWLNRFHFSHSVSMQNMPIQEANKILNALEEKYKSFLEFEKN